MKELLVKSAQVFVDTILPPRCVMSGQPVDRQGMLAPDIWAGLSFISAPQCDTCGYPFDFEISEGMLCASCIDYPPRYDSARAALHYDENSRDLILGFKHGDKTHMARSFTPWLMNAGREMLNRVDVLVPVPLHPRRLIARRYNQSAVIAHILARECGVPVWVDALLRTRHTPPQGVLDISARRKNVRKAFSVNPKRSELVKGKRIVLIDDVHTTGATVNECTRVLRKAGAAEVHVLALARVVRDGFG